MSLCFLVPFRLSPRVVLYRKLEVSPTPATSTSSETPLVAAFIRRWFKGVAIHALELYTKTLVLVQQLAQLSIILKTSKVNLLGSNQSPFDRWLLILLLREWLRHCYSYRLWRIRCMFNFVRLIASDRTAEVSQRSAANQE